MEINKKQIIDSFVPTAVLVPITEEAKTTIINTVTKERIIPISVFPFRIGRESRVGKSERGLFVKLRLATESTPNNDIYLVEGNNSNLMLLDKGNIQISKQHFQIEKNNNGYFIKDRESTLGTKLNNVEIGKEKSNKLFELKDGDFIKIGSSQSKYEFQFLILKED